MANSLRDEITVQKVSYGNRQVLQYQRENRQSNVRSQMELGLYPQWRRESLQKGRLFKKNIKKISPVESICT